MFETEGTTAFIFSELGDNYLVDVERIHVFSSTFSLNFLRLGMGSIVRVNLHDIWPSPRTSFFVFTS